jgi:hypothetical protein
MASDLVEERTTTTAIRLHVGPAKATAGGLRFPVEVEGRELGTFRLPFYDAARALLAEGVDPAVPLELWRDGMLCLSGMTIREAAKWTVVEETEGGIRVRLWKPHPGHPGEEADGP